MIPLPRTVKLRVPPMVGKDVEAHARAMHTYLKDGQLAAFHKQPVSVKRTFGAGKRSLAQRCALKAGLPEYGMVGPNLYQHMRAKGAYDSYSDRLLLDYMQPKPVVPSLVYPIDKDWRSSSGGWVHQTGGITGNYALDWMTDPGAPIVASEKGVVTRTGGHDPATGLHGDNRDVFGWSLYLRCKGGFYYDTHMGKLNVRAGDEVGVGDIVGFVGDWPHDRGRSHLHRGFTSFTYLASVSKAKIRAVSVAPRVDGT